MGDYLVIAGLSGAGRSTAANALEDIGWFVIDNLPPALFPKVAELAQGPGGTIDKVVLVAGTGSNLEGLLAAIRDLRERERVRILFLDAADDVLVNRYESTRRRHPMAEGDRVVEAIARERDALELVKEEADVVVDTSELNVHQLRERIEDLFAGDQPGRGLQTSIVSFGYKHGHPLDADIVLDVRFLPNPHWVEELRPHTGLDAPVRDYVLGQPDTAAFLAQLDGLFDLLLPAYVREGKSYLTVAIGCTGGRHRSPALAEELGRRLREKGWRPSISHRDVER